MYSQHIIYCIYYTTNAIEDVWGDLRIWAALTNDMIGFTIAGRGVLACSRKQWISWRERRESIAQLSKSNSPMSSRHFRFDGLDLDYLNFPNGFWIIHGNHTVEELPVVPNRPNGYTAYSVYLFIDKQWLEPITCNYQNRYEYWICSAQYDYTHTHIYINTCLVYGYTYDIIWPCIDVWPKGHTGPQYHCWPFCAGRRAVVEAQDGTLLNRCLQVAFVWRWRHLRTPW